MRICPTLLLTATLCLAGCMSEERFSEALAESDPLQAGSNEQDILTWLAESEGDAPLRYRAVETAVTLHVRSGAGAAANKDLLSRTLRAEYAAPRLEEDDPGRAEEARRLRAWILFQTGRLQDPGWIPFLLQETADGLAQSADDGRGASGLRGLAELVDAVGGDEDAAVLTLRLAATAAARPQDPRLAQAGPLIAFLRERLATPSRLAALLAAETPPEVHAVLVHWGAATLHRACDSGVAAPAGACDALIAQLLADEAGRGVDKAATAREALAARAPLHLVQGMSARLLKAPDDRASDDLAAALAIACALRPAHPKDATEAFWAHGGRRLCCEPSLAGDEAWNATRAAAVQVLFASAGTLGERPGERERLLCCLCSVAPAESAQRLAAEAPTGPVQAAAHARLEQVARHLAALLTVEGIDAAGIHQALARLAPVEADALQRIVAATLAVRDPAAYLAASAPLMQRLPTLSGALADALIDGTAAALQGAPENLDAGLRSAALERMALAFQRGGEEDARQDRAFACLAPREPGLLAGAIASQLAAAIAGSGPGVRQVLRAAAALPLVRGKPAEAPLSAQLVAIAARPDEECALFAARALAEQRSEAAIAGLRQLLAAEPPAPRAVAALATAALADQPKP